MKPTKTTTMVVAAAAFWMSPVSADVLIAAVGDAHAIADVQEKIAATGLFTGHSIDTINLATDMPSSGTLASYHAVLTYVQHPFDDSELWGDRLADYVDQGGGVVVMSFFSHVHFEGRFFDVHEGAYTPLNAASTDQFGNTGLGEIVCPGHQVFRGVQAFHGGESSFRDVALLTSGAIRLAMWEDDFNFAAEMPGYNGRIIGLNFYPPSSDVRNDHWDASTDGDLIMANALRYVMKPAFPFAKDVKLKQGAEDGGDLSSLHQSDNDRYRIDAERNGPRHSTNAIITLAMPKCSEISALDLIIETGTDKKKVRTKIQMYDFDAKRWETIDSFRQSRTDRKLVYRNRRDPQRFVKPSGSVRVRITSKRSSDYVFEIDRVAIRPTWQ